MGIQNLLAYLMIGIRLQPFLSPAEQHTLSDGSGSAFLPKLLLQPSHMVDLLTYLFSTVELAVIGGRCDSGKIALPDVHPKHVTVGFRSRFGYLDREGHQQVEALLALVIPEFGFPAICRSTQESHMATPALIRDDETSRQCQEAHPLFYLQRVIMPINISQRRETYLGQCPVP